MATAVKEIPIEEKLKQLYELQQIDSQIDRIQILKGELPIEVRDLEDEIAGYRTRLDNLKEEIAGYEQEVQNRRNAKAMASELIARYEKQQDNVKNNREFEALTKEIEMQRLEIQLCETRITKAQGFMETKKTVLEETESLISNCEKNLKAKQKELEKIIEETDKEEQELQKQSDKQSKNIEDRLLKAYKKVRGAYRNGLSVVSIQRSACGGCYAKIPPQRQSEIRQLRRIILCEHCGRILVPFGEITEE